MLRLWWRTGREGVLRLLLKAALHHSRYLFNHMKGLPWLRYLFRGSEGEQMSTGIELFAKDSSRIFLVEAALRAYLWTQ